MLGSGGEPEQRLTERNFMEVDADSVDKVMEAMKPAVAVRVPNRLTDEGEVSVDLQFSSMESLSPEAVVRSVPALSRLLEARARLNDLLAKLDRTPPLQ